MKNNAEYTKDFYAWALNSAQLIRQKKFSEIDIEHIAEEIESMGKSDKRKLINRMAILLAHLLKWHLQPAKRGNSWKYTIKEQRIQILDLLEDSPSLRNELAVKIDHIYEQAVVIAIRQTGLDEKNFSAQCPYTIIQCLDYAFLPD